MYKNYLITFFLVIFSSKICVADFPIVNNIEDAIILSEQTKQPILLVFGAEWCKYCVNLKTDIQDGIFSKELDSVIVCFIDIEKYKHLRLEYKVSNLPDSRMIISNKEESSLIGYNKQKYKQWIINAYSK